MSDSNEFAELLWENGQAVVHGRRKQPPPPPQAAFPPFTCGGAASSSRAQEKHPGTDPVPVALLKTGGLFADFSSGLGAPRDNGDLDDTVPWIHYPIVEEDSAAAPALADSYSPDFLSELHAAAATSLSPLPPPVQHTGDNRSTPVPNPSTGRGSEPSKETNRVPIPIPGPARRPEPHAELAAARKPRPESGGEGLVNFSIFSRPAAMARASLQRPPQTGTDKASNATTSTRVESTVLQLASGPRTAPAVFMDQRTAWSQSKEVRFSCTAAPTTAADLQQERPSNNMTPPQKKVEAMKASEAAGATSSVCSGNGAGTGNDESWRQQKRKSQAECSASQDDDPDDESGGMRRSCSRGAKRSRTAEVHNLSERRRRDRINEKMRALQELIPNCNKIDKASMLDEAIEYLKTLQLQVQMMSMGSGLCIPPMLLPPAMQHLQIPPIAHFPHLGMGLGYGMGVLDMNSTAAVPFPPMPGAHFPCPMIPGAPPQGLGMPGRNTMPVFGVPGQAIQPFPSLAGLPVRPDLAPPQASAAMANVVHEQQQGVATQQQQQSLNNEAQQGANTGDTQLQTIVQGENQRFSVPPSAQTESNQFLDGGGNMTTTGRNEAET